MDGGGSVLQTTARKPYSEWFHQYPFCDSHVSQSAFSGFEALGADWAHIMCPVCALFPVCSVVSRLFYFECPLLNTEQLS